MTSPEILPYWNPTYYVIIEYEKGLFFKYGELAGLAVKKGDEVEQGSLIGRVGIVLNSGKIDGSCPLYIQKLKNKNPSMLHFEVWKYEAITTHENYLGGNWFSEKMPENLKDPARYLESLYSWLSLFRSNFYLIFIQILSNFYPDFIDGENWKSRLSWLWNLYPDWD